MEIAEDIIIKALFALFEDFLPPTGLVLQENFCDFSVAYIADAYFLLCRQSFEFGHDTLGSVGNSKDEIFLVDIKSFSGWSVVLSTNGKLADAKLFVEADVLHPGSESDVIDQ